jgi:transposase
MLWMNEWSDVLMSMTKYWNRGDSSGEGLSHYCGLQLFLDGHNDYYNAGGDQVFVQNWLNGDRTTSGVDIAKNVFQLHYVDDETGEIVNNPVKRAAFLEHFANRTPCLIGMKACGGAQHWARPLMRMGHQVRLMPAESVKAFNIRNKNDAADARAIWLAVQQPSKPVAVKTEAQQAVLALHRMRQQLVKFRTMQINSLRGLLTEYGEVMSKSRAALDKAIPGVLARVAERLPAARSTRWANNGAD